MLCAMANKIYIYVLRIDYTPKTDFYESLTTDYLDRNHELNNHLLVTF